MKVLFIGGTGLISTACTKLAAERGVELFLLNRGQRRVEIPENVATITADIRQPEAVAEALKPHTFDVVVDWIAFTIDHVEADLELFGGRVGQYIFISSASAYQKPPAHYRITESTPLHNPYWEYSRRKAACERRLMKAYREEGFPVTIVRPSYTYGPTHIPASVGGGWTLVDRMRRGAKIIVQGDGQSLWTMTHNSDFARGFVPLLGNVQALGEAFHITSDEVLTWDQIYQCIGRAAGVEPDLVHIPSDLINALDPRTGAGLLGDKACSKVFDNSKLKRACPGFVATVPFAEGVVESVRWHEADPARQIVSEEQNRTMDRIVKAYMKAWPHD